MKKTIIAIFILVMVFSMSAFADDIISEGMDILDNGDELHYKIIDTTDNKSSFVESNAIDFTQSLMRSSTWTRKTKTISARFYLVSSGETVGRYGLDTTFRYNGDYVEIVNAEDWTEDYPGWMMTSYNFTNVISPSYVSVTGRFKLYRDEDMSNPVLHDQTTKRIYCDENGNITLN